MTNEIMTAKQFGIIARNYGRDAGHGMDVERKFTRHLWFYIAEDSISIDDIAGIYQDFMDGMKEVTGREYSQGSIKCEASKLKMLMKSRLEQ